MPLGENIGRAYITILADGDGLDESIRRQFRESEPGVREGGQHHADAYADAFNDGISQTWKERFDQTKKEMFGDINESLTESLADLDFADRFVSDAEFKKFRKRLVNEFGVAGDLAGQRLEQKVRDSGNIQALAPSLGNIGQQVRKAQSDLLDQFFKDARAMNKKISAEQKAAQDQQTKQLSNFFANQRIMYKQFNDAVVKQRQDRDRDFDKAHADALAAELATLDEALAMNKKFNEDVVKLRQDRDQQFDSFNRRSLESDTAMREDALRMNAEFNRRELKQRLDDDKKFELAHAEAARKAASGEDKDRFARFRREHAGLTELITDIRKFSDASGTAFGRGSRNNFLNFTGSVVRNLIGTLSLLPRLLANIGDAAAFVGKGFTKAFTDAGGGLTGFFAGIGGGAAALGEMAAVGIPALIGMAAAATLAVAAIGPLVALASGLVAALTAVAGAISFAVVGGLGLLAGAIAPISFAVAGLGLAFVGLDKATKNTVKNAIKPVIAGVKELGAEVRKPILGAIIGQSAALGGLFSSLAPLFHGVGQSIAQTIRLIVRELTGAGGDSFFNAMTQAMPHAIVDLGEIFVHTFGGFGGILVGLIPSFQRLLDSLEGITFRFSNFTNSARGQNKIKDFMDRAVESAKSLGRLLGETAGLLGDLFSAGRGTGNTIIDDMTQKVREFRNFIRSNPNGLQEWFAHGLDTIRDVGNLIRTIAAAIASLDTAANRQTLSTIFDGLILGAKVAAVVIKALEFNLFLIRAAIGALVIAFAGLLHGLGFLLDGMSHVPFIGGMFKDAANNVHDFADSVFDTGNAITGLPPDIGLSTDDARGNVQGLNSDLEGLTSPVVTPDMNVDPALSEADRLALGLDTLASPVLTPLVETGPAHTALDGLHGDAEGFTSPVIEPTADVGKAGHDLGRLRNDIGEVAKKPFVLRALADVGKAKKDLGALRNEVPGGDGNNRPLKLTVEAHAENARKQIGDLRKDMDGARSPIDLKVRTGSALGAITGLRKGIETVKKPKPIEMTAKTGSALSAVTGLRVGINSIPALKKTKVETQTNQAKKNAESLRDAIGNVKDKKTKIDTQTNQAKKNADTLRDAIGHVKDKTTTMTNRTAQAEKNAHALRDAIGAVHDKTVTVRAITAGQAAVAALAAGINNLHDRTVTVTSLRNEVIRSRREQVPTPGSGGNAPFAADVTVNQATGRVGPTGFAGGGTTAVSTGNSVTIDQLTLVSSSPDPRTVANEFLNSLVAASI